ncbi:MAG: translation initiation factor IF-2 [Microcystaceae cyanobacterium]
MGFADLSIAAIAAEYDLPVETVFNLCRQLGVNYRNQQTNLALEDAKAIIANILSQPSASPLADLSPSIEEEI